MLSEAYHHVATLQLRSNCCSFVAIFATLSSATQKGLVRHWLDQDHRLYILLVKWLDYIISKVQTHACVYRVSLFVFSMPTLIPNQDATINLFMLKTVTFTGTVLHLAMMFILRSSNSKFFMYLLALSI